jgi:hypothetical protein
LQRFDLLPLALTPLLFTHHHHFNNALQPRLSLSQVIQELEA